MRVTSLCFVAKCDAGLSRLGKYFLRQTFSSSDFELLSVVLRGECRWTFAVDFGLLSDALRGECRETFSLDF